jgi:IPT/TIG domain-containing protein
MTAMRSRPMRWISSVAITCLILVLLPAMEAFAVHSVSGVSPSELGQGATAQNLDVQGGAFLPGATVSFSPSTGITINTTTVNSTSSITVNVTISGGATVGDRTVIVTNPLEGDASCVNCLAINEGPKPTSASPATLGQGAHKTVTLSGTGFVDGATVIVAPATGITVGAVDVASAVSMTAELTIDPGAATGPRDITVTNADHGQGVCSACLTIATGPTITNVSPAAGSNTGPVTVTITGTNFVSGVTVALQMTSQTDIGSTVQFVSSTSIKPTFDLALAPPGVWDVVVVNPNFGRATCVGCFTVAAATPTVASAAPNTLGQGASSVDVVLTGTNFAHGATVTVSGAEVTVGTVTTTSSTSLTAAISVSSTAATTARNITVTNTDGQFGVCTNCLTIATGPTATLVDPTSYGQGATGQDFEVTGTGFVSGATISFSGSGVTVGTVVFGSSTSLTTTITVAGGAATGTRDVIVTNPNHGRGVCAGCFTVNPAPVATSLEPASLGQGATGEDVVVNGTGFVDGATVTGLGTGITINTVTFNSATKLTINLDVASGATPNARNVTVTNPDAGTSTCTGCFTVDVSPAITSASPDHLGQGATSQVVTLTGTGFVDGADVTISGTGVTIDDVSFVDATHLDVTMTVGSGATVGARTLTVENPDAGTTACANCFSIAAAPVTTSAAPDALGQGASHSVVLTGTGYVTGATVVVSGTGVTAGTAVVSNAGMTLTVPLTVASDATTGDRDITVTNTDHGTATCTGCLTIDLGPTISNVSPSAGSNTGSSVITITGTNFVDGAAVVLKRSGQPNIDADPVEFVSSTTLKATVDLAAAQPGAWDVVVINPDFGAETCAACFTVAGGTPTVSGASPSALGQGASNVTVDVTGTNFAHGATVAVSGTGVTPGTVTVTSPTHLTVILSVSSSAPATARDITVTNTDSQSGGCVGCFTVHAAPTITSISPAQRAPGLTDQDLVISGSGFATGITVAFSGTGITVNSVTFNNSSSITVNVDLAGGATVGARNVTLTNTDGGTKVCTGCFHVTGPTTVTIVTPNTLSGGVLAIFSQPVSGVSSSNYRMKLTGTATLVPGSIACNDGAGHAVSCSTGTVRIAVFTPSPALTSGQYYTVEVAPGGSPAITDYGGLTVDPETADFRASRTEEAETSPSAGYAWGVVSTSRAYGGSYVVDNLAQARATFRFSGTSVTWYTNMGPSYGLAYVYIDNKLKGSFNLYSSSARYLVARGFSGLSSGSHVFTIVVRGLKGSTAGTGTDVAVDAFAVAGTRYSSPSLTYAWRKVSASSAYGGMYTQDDKRGALAAFTFRGTQVDWYTVLGTSMGTASVYIDGVLRGTFDNYSSSTHYRYRRSFGGLSDGIHTIKIRVNGLKRSASHGYFIDVDRFVVT